MKKLLGLLALGTASTACQQSAPATQAAAALAPAAAAAVPAATLPPARQQLLAQRDLAIVLQTVTDPNLPGGPHIYNGFFGPSHRRIEVVLTAAQRSISQPNLYYLRGKNRYRGIITPFAGTWLIEQVVDQQPFTKAELGEGADPAANKEPMYTAVGTFVLREDSTQKNSGVFRGRVALDWHVTAEGEVRQESRTSHTLTQRGGTKFEGTWTKYGTASPKPVVWVEDIFAYGPSVLNEFAIGEREQDFNPKYAKLGWNTYWTNDEWWVDSPGVVASRQ